MTDHPITAPHGLSPAVRYTSLAPIPMYLAHSSTGVALSLTTAGFWALSPMFMASVGRRIGSYHTNLLRLVIAALALCLFVLPGYLLMHGPAHLPTRPQLAWVLASGIAGMVIGDIFFYETLVIAGPRRAVKLNTLAPVFAIFLAWFINGEHLSARVLGGALLVIIAIMYATFRQTTAAVDDEPAARGEPARMGLAGFLCGVASAFCVGLGSVLQRKAFQSTPELPLDRIVATVIRVGAAAGIMWVWPVIRGQAPAVLRHMGNAPLRSRMLAGVVFGPLGGMLCYISALSLIEAGLVSTLVAASPLITIPVMAAKYRIRIGWDIVLATAVAVAGVAIVSVR
ncbi:MAG: DMT family transporter [Tepidisphaerales bacterium]